MELDQAAVDEVAKLFVQARTTGARLDALPARLKPVNFADSRAVMDAVDRLSATKSSAPRSPPSPAPRWSTPRSMPAAPS
jgi:hypothetical protein